MLIIEINRERELLCRNCIKPGRARIASCHVAVWWVLHLMPVLTYVFISVCLEFWFLIAFLSFPSCGKLVQLFLSSSSSLYVLLFCSWISLNAPIQVSFQEEPIFLKILKISKNTYNPCLRQNYAQPAKFIDRLELSTVLPAEIA